MVQVLRTLVTLELLLYIIWEHYFVSSVIIEAFNISTTKNTLFLCATLLNICFIKVEVVWIRCIFTSHNPTNFWYHCKFWSWMQKTLSLASFSEMLLRQWPRSGLLIGSQSKGLTLSKFAKLLQQNDNTKAKEYIFILWIRLILNHYR